MVPFSSDRLLSAAQREPVRLPDAADIATSAQESFEKHLRHAASSGTNDRPDAAEPEGDDQQTRNENTTAPDESQVPAGAANEQEDAAGAEPREDDGAVATESDEPPSDEQPEGDEAEAGVFAAHADQRVSDETLDLDADAVEATAKDRSAERNSSSDDAALRNEQSGTQTLEELAEPELAEAAATEEVARHADQSDSSQDRLIRADTTDVATEDQAHLQRQRGLDSRASEARESSVSQEAGLEQTEQVGTTRKSSDALPQQINEAAVAAREAELSAEALSQDDGASQNRNRDRHSQVVQKVDSAPSESGAAPPTAANRFAQHLTTQSSERSGGLQISDADHRRFVDRVARALPTAEGRGGTLRVRLSPPELGALRLEVKVLNGTLTAKVEAETPLARSLLLDSLPVLRERLEGQGVRVDQFDVDLLDRQTPETPNGLEQQRDQQDDSPADREATAKQEETTDETPGLIATTPSGDEQLNVII